MDTLYRKSNYEAIVKKLNRLVQGSDNIDIAEKHELLQGEVNQIIESLRNRGDQSNARIHYILLAVPLALIAVWHMITTASYALNISILLMIGILIALAHFRMKKVITESQSNSPQSASPASDSAAFILMKMTYVEKAMDIKRSRLLLVSIFYILLFPLFLIRLHDITFEGVAFESGVMAYVVAYLIGGALWFFYYNRAFEVYEDIDKSLDYIRASLV